MVTSEPHASRDTNVLRPRSFGEILDRGTTVFVRSFWRAVLLCLPLLVAVGAFAGLLYVLAHRPEPPYAAFGVFPLLFVVLIAFIASLFYLFGCVAEDRPCTARDAFSAGWRRTFPLLGLFVLVWLAFVLALVVVAAPIAVLVALGGNASIVGGFFGGIAVIVLAIASIPFFLIFQIAFATASSACAYEGLGPVASIAAARRRCCTKATWKRAGLCGVAVFALSFFSSLLASPIVFIATIVAPNNPVAFAAAYALQISLQFAASLASYAWITVFSLDARIRLDGFDLTAAAAALGE